MNIEPVDVLTIVASVTALILSYLAYRQSNQLRVSSLHTELAQQVNLINESFARYRIRSPYAVLLDIKPDDIARFEALSAIFFHHINMLNIVYRNRKLLGKESESAYKEWVITTFRPWLESDRILIEHWHTTRASRDIYGRDFIGWFEPLLPIHRKVGVADVNGVQ